MSNLGERKAIDYYDIVARGFPYDKYVEIITGTFPKGSLPKVLTLHDIATAWSIIMANFGRSFSWIKFMELVATIDSTNIEAFIEDLFGDIISEARRRREIIERFIRDYGNLNYDKVLQRAKDLALGINLVLESVLPGVQILENVEFFSPGDLIHPNPNNIRLPLSFVGANMLEMYIKSLGLPISGIEGYFRDSSGSIDPIDIALCIEKRPEIGKKLIQEWIPEIRERTAKYFQ